MARLVLMGLGFMVFLIGLYSMVVWPLSLIGFYLMSLGSLVSIAGLISSPVKSQTPSETEDPLRLLQIRYAKGEITREEYEEMREVLEEKS